MKLVTLGGSQSELNEVALDLDWLPQQPFLLRIQARYKVLQKYVYRQLKRIGIKNIGKQHKHMLDALVRERLRLLEKICPQVRDFCLDHESDLWEYVDRNKFEQLMSERTDPLERLRRHETIFDIITLFYYKAIQ